MSASERWLGEGRGGCQTERVGCQEGKGGVGVGEERGGVELRLISSKESVQILS